MSSQALILIYNLLFLATAFLIVCARLLSVEIGLLPLPGPDLLFCLIAAWKIRNPRYVHPAAIVTVILLTEILFFRPFGLWSALVLLASEFVAKAGDRARLFPFTYEWLIMLTAYAAISAAYQFILAVFLVPVLDVLTTVLIILSTAAAYPLVAIVTNLVFRIWKTSEIRAGSSEWLD